MNLFRSLTDPKSTRRRIFRGLLLMSLAAGAVPARADQPIVLPPAIHGDLRPVLVLGGVESAKPQALKDATQHLVTQEKTVVVPPASPATNPLLVRPSVPALKIQPAISASASSESSEVSKRDSGETANNPAELGALIRPQSPIEATVIEKNIVVEQTSPAPAQPTRRPQPQIVQQVQREEGRPEGQRPEDGPQRRRSDDAQPTPRPPQFRDLENRSSENRNSENRNSENRGEPDRGPRDQAPENRGPEVKGPGDRRPEDRGPEQRRPDDRGPGDRRREERGPEQRRPEERGPEEHRPDQRGPGARRGGDLSWSRQPGPGFYFNRQDGQNRGMTFVPNNADQPRPPFLGGLGAPGMDPRVHLAQGSADADKLLASPLIKRLLELMEQNTELKAQLKIQEIQMEAKARLFELESKLRSQEEHSMQAAKALQEKQHHFELQRNELQQLEQKLDAQRKALEQQRDELHHQAAMHKGQIEFNSIHKDAAAETGKVRHQQIEVRVVGDKEAEMHLEAKQPSGSQESHNLTQSVHTKLAAELAAMAEKLAKSEAAFKEASVSKEALSKRLAELEHRSRLLEEKAKALAQEKDSQLENQRSFTEKRLRELEEVRQDVQKRAEEAQKRAEARVQEQKAFEEAKLKEQKAREEAKKKEEEAKEAAKKDEAKKDEAKKEQTRKKESEKKDKKKDGEEKQ